MKKTFYLFVALVLVYSAAHANPLLKQAEQAYDSKKYKEAISCYEKLVEEGFQSWQLYFNLGNAYYRDQQLGKAIYNYELSRKLEPNDEDVNINLGIAAAKTVDKIDSKENFFIAAVKTGLLTTFTTKTWGWLSVVSLLLAAFAFYFFFAGASVVIRRFSFFMACVFAVTFASTYLLGFSALKARYANKFAIVFSKEVKVMNEPTQMAKSKFMLHEGTRIRVVDTNGDWVLIKLDNGNEGWLKLVDVGII